MDQEELLYSLEITNGYVFRQIFELYVKLVIQFVQIFFSKDIITIRTGSGVKNGRKIITSTELNPNDLINYYFNEKCADIKETEDNPAIIVEQFNITDIGNNFKSIAKTSGIQFYREKEKKITSFRILGLTTDTFWVNCSKYQPVNYDLSGFEDIPETPNIKIDIKQFCAQLKSMNKGDPECFVFKVYKNALEIESRNSNDVILRKGSFGKIKGSLSSLSERVAGSSDKEEEYFTTKVNSSVVDALGKINSMAIYSIVKIFCCKDGYLQISHKIGDFGNHNIYLIEENEA